ncbi:MAG TPA: helix-turn-helix domain-containing protein [Candidatus Limnocylindrales bacterium]|nr:helix-turn-helix domain-containing protein [Candidatus Limnocylindrales bacterium]
MPRLTPAQERAVRDRIVAAAVRAFCERGYHGTTIQDIVRESGLSVGAIYSHFTSKDELFVAASERSIGAAMAELAERLAGGRSVADKLAIAIGFYVDAIEPPGGRPGMASFLVTQWARADEPAVRAMLVRRRDQLVAAGRMLLHEGIARGALPAWIDPEAVAAAYTALLDGLLLYRLEAGPGYRRAEAERRARALLEVLLAARAAPDRPAVPEAPPRPWAWPPPEPGTPGREPAAPQRSRNPSPSGSRASTTNVE